ncbi:TatD family nuclease-associated radical SAM protein [[Eubacterium] cellulosolvens]
MNDYEGSITYRYSLCSNTIYLNITNRCTNNCIFCIKTYSSGLQGYRLTLDKEPTLQKIWESIRKEVKKSDREIVWCGFGEPTIRLDMVLNLTKKIKKEYPLIKVRLNTDGLAQLRNKNIEVAKELKDAGIDSVSISLNAENSEKYEEICRPSISKAYQAVLDFARDCRKYFSNTKLTVVGMNGIDIPKCEKIAANLGCDFRVR